MGLQRRQVHSVMLCGVANFGSPYVQSLVQSCARRFRGVFLTTFLVCFAAVASAANLVAIVSERNSDDLAQAAHDFNQSHPNHRLQLRTSAQIDALSDAQLRELIGGADTVLLANFFKEPAQRLKPLLTHARAEEIIAVAGDPALGRFSRWRGQRLFADDDARYAELSSLTAEKDASAASVALSIRKYPSLASWIRARAYWQNRGEANLVSLLALALSEQDKTLQAAARKVEDAQPIRFRYQGEWRSGTNLKLAGTRRVVAILDDQHANSTVSDAICEALARRQLDCLSVFAGW